MGNTFSVECGFIQHVGEGGGEWLGKKDTGIFTRPSGFAGE